MDKIREILSKASLTGEDISFLVANKDALDQKDLERLGLVPATPSSVVEEPVKDAPVMSGVAKAAQEEIAKQSIPPVKKKGKGAKKS